MAVAEQKSTVSRDAIAYRAKPRDVNEKPFLKERGYWVVEITRLGKIPKPLDQLGCVLGGGKEIRDKPETSSYLLLK
jgi:hypothetical protein